MAITNCDTDIKDFASEIRKTKINNQAALKLKLIYTKNDL